ncbi:MAG: hypothetical protein HYV07_21660 [Deltaproteobacteria bacterium]|nr:hypothetical protein [Deltaproteobacteria bacterium]
MKPALRFLHLALAGCGLTLGEDPCPSPDFEQFEEVVNEIFVARCGASSCHGTDARGFNLYGQRQRRRSPNGTFSSAPLTAEEVKSNYDSTLGFILEPAPLETVLIVKALGGAGHLAVFEHRSDPECRAVRAWLGAAE